jgi:hypothetical protein
MILDINNISVEIEDRVVTKVTNLSGTPQDWILKSGSFQVVMINMDYDTIIKIPNISHGDSFKLMKCSGVATWGRPDDITRPITKYTPYQLKATYSLLQFHYENGFGPKVGRIFDININNETYFAFEQERLPEVSYFSFLRKKYNIPHNDTNAVNTVTYNEYMADDGIISLYKKHDALIKYDDNHIIAHKTDDQRYDIGYKADCSIFFMKDGKPKCFDIDYNGINAYFNPKFIDSLIEKYSKIIEEQNFSDYLYS